MPLIEVTQMKPCHYILTGKKIFPPGAAVLAVLSFILISGCYLNYAGYGKYQQSREVAVMFEHGNFPPHYAYYYAHTVSQPDALIGIEPEFTLDNHLWSRVEPSRLKRLMDNIWIHSGFSPFIYGSYILSPEGRTIGIYYSKWNGGPIMMGSDNKVIIHLPYKQDEKPRLFFQGWDD